MKRLVRLWQIPALMTLPFIFCFGSSLPGLSQSLAEPNAEAALEETDLPTQPFSTFDPEASSGKVNSAYILGPGDAIEITVLGYEEYTGSKVILPDGTIELSLIGSITAAGMTIDQLRQELTNRLQLFLVDPFVSINLITLRPVVINVAGEVMRPGPLQLVDGTTLSAALVQAGGITRDADIRQVTLRRYDPTGESSPIKLDLWEAISSDNPPPDPILQAGDSIYVPRLTADSTLDRRRIAMSSLAPETVRIRVVGEVELPGEVQVPPNSSLSSAVAIAGGPTSDARLSQVSYVRLNEDGQVERQVVDLRNLVDDYQVQDGDVIFVPEQDTSTILDLAGRVLGPFGSIINIIFSLDRLVR